MAGKYPCHAHFPRLNWVNFRVCKTEDERAKRDDCPLSDPEGAEKMQGTQGANR